MALFSRSRRRWNEYSLNHVSRQRCIRSNRPPPVTTKRFKKCGTADSFYKEKFDQITISDDSCFNLCHDYSTCFRKIYPDELAMTTMPQFQVHVADFCLQDDNRDQSTI